jgi:hypothetical protein
MEKPPVPLAIAESFGMTPLRASDHIRERVLPTAKTKAAPRGRSIA